MADKILVDTGPIVALLRRRDAFHEECKATVAEHSSPMLSCWPVITEAAWLLRDDPDSIRAMFAWIDTGLVELASLPRESAVWISDFMTRYRSIEAQVADAALAYLAETIGIETVFTLDRRDFSIYRIAGGKALTLLPA